MKNIIIELQKFSSEIDQLKYLVEKYPTSFFSILNKNSYFLYLKKYVFNNTKFLSKDSNMSLRVYCVIHHMIELPKCYNCGKMLHENHFRGINKGFAQYCNSKCSNSDVYKKEKIKTIFLEKYGSTSSFSNKELREKAKKTKLRKYGDENYTNKEKAQQTCAERYGVDNPFKSLEIKKKIKMTLIKKYGAENCMQNKEIQQKQYQSMLKHFGPDNINNREKAAETYRNHTEEQKKDIHDRTIQTNLERYGVESPTASKEIQDKISTTKQLKHGDKNYNNREKAQQTCIEKYGVTSYTKTNEFKEKLSKSNERRMQRQYLTKKKNHSFSFSKQELEVYKRLLEKFTVVERQYKSEKYPFKCDFYIPEKDLYIEYNGSWTHGTHPYDEKNESDQIRLKHMKEKSLTSDYYKSAIKTWTIVDPLKRLTAKQNKLNYIELWKIDDINRI